MTPRPHRVGRSTLLAALVLLGLVGDTGANGREVVRELVGRVVAASPERGLTVEREVGGRVFRLEVVLPSDALVLYCAPGAARLEATHGGTPVSVFYEPAGREGLANLVVVESWE